MSERPQGPASGGSGLPPEPEPDPSAGSQPDTVVREDFGTGGLRALTGRVSWAIVAEAANLVGTALLFLVVASALDPDGYGSLQAVIAIAMIAGPLATFGANWQLIRRTVISADPAEEAGRAISTALIGTGAAAVLLLVVAVLIPAALSDISRLTMALVLVGQMPAFWLVELATTSAVARADLRLSAQMRVAAVLMRLAGLGLFLAVGSRSLDSWAWYFAGGNLGAAGVTVWMLARSLGRWPRLTLPPREEFTTGFPYGAGNTTQGFLSASDRPILKQYGFGHETGVYSAGYRVVSLGLVPMMAVLRAQDRRFFRQGANGAAASHQAATKLMAFTLVATVPVTVGLLLAAPLFAHVIGPQWTETDEVIRLLAFLPIIKGFQFAYGNALTAAGNQKPRLWLTGVAAVGNLVGNIIFIPSGSWRAAVATTLVAEIGLAIAFAIASRYYASTRPTEPAEPATAEAAP